MRYILFTILFLYTTSACAAHSIQKFMSWRNDTLQKFIKDIRFQTRERDFTKAHLALLHSCKHLDKELVIRSKNILTAHLPLSWEHALLQGDHERVGDLTEGAFFLMQHNVHNVHGKLEMIHCRYKSMFKMSELPKVPHHPFTPFINDIDGALDTSEEVIDKLKKVDEALTKKMILEIRKEYRKFLPNHDHDQLEELWEISELLAELGYKS